MRKGIIVKIIALVLAILAFSMFFACDKEDGKAEISKTIRFIQNGQTVTRKTVNGHISDVPALNEIEGYTPYWEYHNGNVGIPMTFEEILAYNFANDSEEMACRFEANAKANDYKITYTVEDGESWDGEEPYNDGGEYYSIVTYRQSYSLPKLKKDNKVFVSWMYNETPVNAVGTWNIAKNVTLTSTWEDKKETEYAVVFTYTEGGETKKVVVKREFGVYIDPENDEDVPKLPVEEGKYIYTWADVNGVDVDFSKINSDTEVFMKRTPVKYNVVYKSERSFKINGSDKKVKKQGDLYVYTAQVEYGTVFYPQGGITTADYEFKGWLDKDGNKFEGGNKWEQTEDMELTASWEYNDEWSGLY